MSSSVNLSSKAGRESTIFAYHARRSSQTVVNLAFRIIYSSSFISLAVPTTNRRDVRHRWVRDAFQSMRGRGPTHGPAPPNHPCAPARRAHNAGRKKSGRSPRKNSYTSFTTPVSGPAAPVYPWPLFRTGLLVAIAMPRRPREGRQGWPTLDECSPEPT